MLKVATVIWEENEEKKTERAGWIKNGNVRWKWTNEEAYYYGSFFPQC